MRRRMRIVVLLCSGLAAASSGCAGDGPIVESVDEAVQITPPPFDAKAALAKARSLAQAYLSQPQPSGMDFIRYAAHSPAADRETVRKLLQTYAQDGAFVQQMSEAVFKIWTADYDLALIGLAGAIVARSVRSPVSSRIHFVPGPRKAWRLTMLPSA